MSDDMGTQSALDLPQIHTKPSFFSLVSTLSKLTLGPTSWEDGDETQTEISNKGVAAYLTRLISSPLPWLTSDEEREKIWDEASKRLGERAGYSSIERGFDIPTGSSVEGNEEVVTVRLHEPALVGDNVGHKTWMGSYLLAKRLFFMVPQNFPSVKPMFTGRTTPSEPNTVSSPKIRVLELGAGTGLAGMAASVLFPATTVTHLTDLPSILPNLQTNISSNSTLFAATTITAGVLDWSDLPHTVSSDERYDLILAADSLYAPEHPNWLTNAMVLFLKHNRNARVFVELPYRDMDRDYHGELGNAMEAKGFRCLEQGDEAGFEDWQNWAGRVEVECWWSVWGWSEDFTLARRFVGVEDEALAHAAQWDELCTFLPELLEIR